MRGQDPFNIATESAFIYGTRSQLKPIKLGNIEFKFFLRKNNLFGWKCHQYLSSSLLKIWSQQRNRIR